VTGAGATARAAELATLGHRAPLDRDALARLVDAVGADSDARVRAVALGALVRAAPTAALGAWSTGVVDADAAVRRRAAEVSPALPRDDRIAAALVALLADDDVTVVEAAAWALGELGARAVEVGAVADLAATARGHRDALAREAAVAALGALGDPTALPVILEACHDKPAVRRRAVLALAPFDGPEVDAALAAALDDRDWQVRQAAEDLSGE
jgi:HEAT repeat protein